MTLDDVLVRLADRLASNVEHRRGVVRSIHTGPPMTLTLAVNGDEANPISEIPLSSSYSPAVGDAVHVLVFDGAKWLVTGTEHG